jgi:hypothetical protein
VGVAAAWRADGDLVRAIARLSLPARRLDLALATRSGGVHGRYTLMSQALRKITGAAGPGRDHRDLH